MHYLEVHLFQKKKHVVTGGDTRVRTRRHTRPSHSQSLYARKKKMAKIVALCANPFYDHIVPLASLQKINFFASAIYHFIRVSVSQDRLGC